MKLCKKDQTATETRINSSTLSLPSCGKTNNNCRERRSKGLRQKVVVWLVGWLVGRWVHRVVANTLLLLLLYWLLVLLLNLRTLRGGGRWFAECVACRRARESRAGRDGGDKNLGGARLDAVTDPGIKLGATAKKFRYNFLGGGVVKEVSTVLYSSKQ